MLLDPNYPKLPETLPYPLPSVYLRKTNYPKVPSVLCHYHEISTLDLLGKFLKSVVEKCQKEELQHFQVSDFHAKYSRVYSYTYLATWDIFGYYFSILK